MHLLRLLLPFSLAATAAAQLPPSALRPARPTTPPPSQPARSAPVPANPSKSTPPVKPSQPAGQAPAAQDVPDVADGPLNALTPTEAAEGWKLLFDGERLTGLRGLQRSEPLSSGWKVIAGTLVLPKTLKQMDRVTGGDLATTEQFWDFDFRFEWRATVSANSGIRYFVGSISGQTPPGLEYQIIDDVHNSISLKGGPLRRSGALDNVIPVNPDAALRSARTDKQTNSQWNQGRIVVQGNTVQHWLNGAKTCEFELGAHLRATAEKNRDRKDKAPRPHVLFGMKTKTPVVILDEGTEVAFRNLKIRALAPETARTQPAQGGAER